MCVLAEERCLRLELAGALAPLGVPSFAITVHGSIVGWEAWVAKSA